MELEFETIGSELNGFLNRCCSFGTRLESMLLRDPLQNPFSTVSVRIGPSNEDSILWLWTTNHHMREAFALLDAWGFEQKTILTWAKDKMGTGDWLRGQTEHAIMAMRGSPIVTLTNQSTLLLAPARGHSVKPVEFYDLVERLIQLRVSGITDAWLRKLCGMFRVLTGRSIKRSS